MEQIQQVVTQLFIATDQRDWEEVARCFAQQVLLDYSSMTGNPAVSLAPSDITNSWKGVLPGFTHTHHQLGNFILKQDDNRAKVFCYGTATHFLENENGNVWTVIGTYDFDLEQQDNNWKITSMTFNFKYQDGNSGLIEQAIKVVNDGILNG